MPNGTILSNVNQQEIQLKKWLKTRLNLDTLIVNKE